MKLFLDTNALLDYYAQRQPFFEDMKKLRIAQYCGDVEFWASTQSFTDIEYILRGALPLSDLRSMMSNSLSFISVVSPTPASLAKGLGANYPDLEDCLIASCAEDIRASYIITRDAKRFSFSSIPALSAKEWLCAQENRGIVYDEIEF